MIWSEKLNFLHEDLKERLSNSNKIRDNFNNNLPFKFLYFKNFFNKEFINNLSNYWPNSPDIEINTDVNKRSFYRNNLPRPFKKIINNLNSSEFITLIENVTGFTNLLHDPELENGGLHETFNDGYLGLHIDNLLHSRKDKVRVLNLIIYLSESWYKENSGELILSSLDGKVKKTIEPHFNSAVFFEVNKYNLHGAPNPFRSSNGCKSRRSIALFYYQKAESKLDLSTRTYWKYKNNFRQYGDTSDDN